MAGFPSGILREGPVSGGAPSNTPLAPQLILAPVPEEMVGFPDSIPEQKTALGSARVSNSCRSMSWIASITKFGSTIGRFSQKG
jgi:hypothetical protein